MATDARAPLPTIQLLRAFAALLVALGHVVTETLFLGKETAWFDPMRAKYHFGVDIFFVISGFIMVYSTAGQGASAAGGVRFFVARFLRISPLYWLVTFAALLLALVLRQGFNQGVPDATRVLASLFYFPLRNEDGMLFPVIGPGWTLNYEMMFYLVFAIGLAVYGSRGIWATIGVLIGIVLLGSLTTPDQPQLWFWTRPILLEFVFGMLLGNALLKGRLDIRSAALPWALMAIGFGWYLLPWFGEHVRTNWRFVLFGIPAAFVVAGALIGDLQRRLPRFRWGEAVGDASYSIYLTHIFVVRGLSIVWHKLPVQPSAYVFIPVAMALVIAVGIAVARLFEIPMHRITRTWLSRRRVVTASE